MGPEYPFPPEGLLELEGKGTVCALLFGEEPGHLWALGCFR